MRVGRLAESEFELATNLPLQCYDEATLILMQWTVSGDMNRIRTRLCPSLARPLSNIRARVQVRAFPSKFPDIPSDTLLRTELHTSMHRDPSRPPSSIPSIADTTTFASLLLSDAICDVCPPSSVRAPNLLGYQASTACPVRASSSLPEGTFSQTTKSSVLPLFSSRVESAKYA